MAPVHNMKGWRDDMPFGFFKEETVVTYGEAKLKPEKLILIKDLKFEKKKELVTKYWKKGYWNNLVTQNEHIDRNKATNLVNALNESEYQSESNKLGHSLLDATLMHFEHMYEALLPMDKSVYPLSVIPDLSFTIRRGMKIPIKIYKIDENGAEIFVKRMKRRKKSHLVAMRKKEKPDYVGQLWLAKDLESNIISGFMALPECTEWDFVDFASERFVPSTEVDNEQRISVTVNNNLNTYTNLYMVNSTNSTRQLQYLQTLAPKGKFPIDECWVGKSFVAIQGETVFSEFQVLSDSSTEWTIETEISIPKITKGYSFDTTNQAITPGTKSADLKPFTIRRGMKIPIKIYKIDKNGEHIPVKGMKGRKKSHLVRMRKSETPDYVGQVWLAKDLESNIISGFMALPGCTEWDFVDFASERFVPSTEVDNEQRISVTVNNNLNTYINLYMVNSTRQLQYLQTLAPKGKFPIDECWVGKSFVAIQGKTVFSEFQVLSDSSTEWTIETEISIPKITKGCFFDMTNQAIKPDTHSADLKPFTIRRGMKIPIEIYKIDENGEHIPVKEMKERKTSHLVRMRKSETPDYVGQVWLAKDLESNIISGFMALPGCTKWDFRDFPPNQFIPSLKPERNEKNITVTIKNNLNTYVNLYMVRSTGQLHQLYILSPKEKDLKLDKCWVGYSLVAMQGTAVFSNFQVLTSDNDTWSIDNCMEKKVQFIKNIAEGMLDGGKLKKCLKNCKDLSNIILKVLQNELPPVNEVAGDILLTHCNYELCDDEKDKELLKDISNTRTECVYPLITVSRYRNKCQSLSQVNRDNFQACLLEKNIRLVSFSGHGNTNGLYGFDENGTDTAILTSSDIVENPNLVKDKIFHVHACWVGEEGFDTEEADAEEADTEEADAEEADAEEADAEEADAEEADAEEADAEEADAEEAEAKKDNKTTFIETILKHHATAFIGYTGNVTLFTDSSMRLNGLPGNLYMLQHIPDCIVVLALIKGETVEGAVELGKMTYEYVANIALHCSNGLLLAKYARLNGKFLEWYGNKNARL